MAKSACIMDIAGSVTVARKHSGSANSTILTNRQKCQVDHKQGLEQMQVLVWHQVVVKSIEMKTKLPLDFVKSIYSLTQLETLDFKKFLMSSFHLESFVNSLLEAKDDNMERMEEAWSKA